MGFFGLLTIIQMKQLRLLFALGVLLPVCFSSPILFFGATEPEMPQTKTDPAYRLPVATIEISEYDIMLTPHFDGENAFTFDGEVKIRAKILSDTISIKMHAKALKFESVVYKVTKPEPGDEIVIDDINSFETMFDFWKITFPTLLAQDSEIEIIAKYKGVLGDDMHGFYASSYVEKGATKWMGTTQFQPVHARRAFPCFDEPHYKAHFIVSIVRPKSFSPTLSNTKMAGIPVDVGELLVKETFEQTPKMSSYLIAFIVSQYVAAETTTDTDLEHFAIWARPEAKAQGKFAFDTSKNIITKLGEYLGYPFKDMDPSLKNDHVSIPDFSAGAMENWGLATYREAYLMASAEDTSVRYYQQIAAILAHEIAHFWFGDLVTCDWWDQTWLNEGFARYFQYYLTDMVVDMEMTTQFSVAQIQSVMLIDASMDSTPMSNVNTNSPAEVQAQFGSVSYNKAAAVIRMMKEWIGPETFKKALTSYIAAYQFKTVKEENLFEHLQMAATEDATIETTDLVETVMSAWSRTRGFPVLNVNVNRETGTVTISQKEFVNEGDTVTTAVMWPIPITFTTKTEMNFDNLKPKMIFSTASMDIPDKLKADDWIMFNNQQIGYYRVSYDNKTWEMLSETLKENRTKINTLNRAQYVDDLFNFARQSVIDYKYMLDLIEFLETESDYAPWTAAFAGFSFMRLRFHSIPEILELINKHTLTMMKRSLIPDIGLEGKAEDSHLRKLFRMETLKLACQLGHEACIQQSTSKFDAYKKDSTKVDPNLREHVYCTALRHGTGDDFDVLWNKYVNESVINEKVVILNALGCTTHSEKLDMLLYQSILKSSPIRDQDKMAAFNSALTGNPKNVEVVYAFVKTNIVAIKEVYGSANLRSMFGSMASRMTTTHLDSLKEMLTDNVLLTATEIESGTKSVDNAKSDIEWAKSKEEHLNSWLTAKYNSAGALTVSFTLMLSMLTAIFLHY